MGKLAFAPLAAVFGLAAGSGGLTQLPGKAGCVSSSKLDTGCTRGHVVATPGAVAVSPDGRNVYAAGGMRSLGALAVFARSPSGALVQQACLTASKLSPACALARTLESPAGLALSPDGRSLYVAAGASGAIAVFSRQPATGALTQLSSVTGLARPQAVAVSPDGQNVYAAANGIVVYTRDSSTGALSSLQNITGAGGEGVAVSPDGVNVYLTAGAGTHGSITSFVRDPTTGRLLELGCVAQNAERGCLKGAALRQPRGVTVSPDGKNVYVASAGSDGIAVFLRTPAGMLAQLPERGGCVTDSGSGGLCARAGALAGASAVAVAPNGRTVYAVSSNPRRGGIAVFDRDQLNGRLSETACVGAAPLAGCSSGRNIVAAGDLAIASEGGATLYTVAAGQRSPGGLPHGGGVAVFRRRG